MNNFRSLILFLISLLVGCAAARPPVPVGSIPEAKPLTVEDEQYGHEILNQLSQKFTLDYNNPEMNRIQDVVDKLTVAANASKDPWHVYVFKDDSFKNAAATRGNHIFIWTGMLNEAKSDAELAVILAHEIGHVLARHTEPDPNEEFKRIMIQVGALAAGIAVATATRDPSIASDLGQITQVLTQEMGEGLLMNPFSKDQELEADQIGLVLLAEAGYDPQDALNFWRRAENNPEFSSSIPFFSTHPPADERLAKLEQTLPVAQSRYRKDGAVPTLEPQPSQSSTAEVITTPVLPLADSQPPSNQWRIKDVLATIYSSPSTGARKVGEIKQGELIEVREIDDDWVELGGGYSGWIERKVVSAPGVEKSVATAPVDESQPLPAPKGDGK